MRSTKKNQNSLLVIATLGVYFGLILSGATPQVLASAAMARQFDVKDEIELTDELDTLPDDKRSPVTDSVSIYVDDIETFLVTLARLRSSGRFDPAADSFSVAQNTLLPCVAGNVAGRYTPIRFISTSETFRPALEYFSREMTYGYSLGDCLTNNEFDGLTAAESRFSFELDRKSFSVTIIVRKESPQRALDLVRDLESTIRLYSSRARTPVQLAVLANTQVAARRDQVFVVTRLPRAGLSSLLSARS